MDTNCTQEKFALSINTDKCGNCIFCVSVCPFEAIAVIPETKKVKVDESKCRLCGICYATCPSGLISIEYYNTEILSEYIQKKVKETEFDKVVLACRGTGLTPTNWREKLKRDESPKSVFFTIPCLGRIHLNFLLNTAETGVQKISLIGCKEDYCRYKKGSEIMANKFVSAQAVFEDMGYPAEMIEFQTMAPRAHIDETKCIACGTCAFVCPYEAIRIEQSAKLDQEKCRGCGLCVPSCPAIAITIESSEFDVIGKKIETFATESSTPKILVLGCQWSEYRSADENAPAKPGVKFVPLPCSGRTDILHILKALALGIDGVMVSMCLDDICNLETGNKRSLSRLSKLNELLEKLDIHERVKVSLVHPKYMGMFEDELNGFIQKIKELGLSPIGNG